MKRIAVWLLALATVLGMQWYCLEQEASAWDQTIVCIPTLDLDGGLVADSLTVIARKPTDKISFTAQVKIQWEDPQWKDPVYLPMQGFTAYGSLSIDQSIGAPAYLPGVYQLIVHVVVDGEEGRDVIDKTITVVKKAGDPGVVSNHGYVTSTWHNTGMAPST